MYEHIINEEIIAVHQLCKLVVLIHYAFLVVDRTPLTDDEVEETEKSRLLKLHEDISDIVSTKSNDKVYFLKCKTQKKSHKRERAVRRITYHLVYHIQTK